VRLSRRAFLAGGLLAACSKGGGSAAPPRSSTTTSTATATAPTTASPTTTLPRFDGPAFTLGVASGDPAPDGVVLWTRLLPAGGMPDVDVPVRWEVAADDRFADVVATGTATAAPGLAHSVHVEVGGLSPGRDYWYRFLLGDEESTAGRTRTLPAAGAAVDRVRLAFVSCQHWEAGWWPAYGHLAREDLDLVVHLGDYVYEGGRGGDLDGRAHEPAHECITLDDYRARYAQYKGDPALQAAHAVAPWVVTWDDHEVENNYAGETVDADRQLAGYLAWYEHQPVRLPRPSALPYPVHRSFDVGGLARLFLLDTRQYRSDQPCDQAQDVGGPCDELAEAGRTMAGAEQEAWLFDGLASSPATWNVIGQQTVMARLDLFAGPGELFNLDQWDGYPAARSRLLGHLAGAGVANPVVLTGDIHASGVADLLADFADPSSAVVATELVGTSISSGFPAEFAGPVRAAVDATPWARYFEPLRRGYVRCTVDESQWLAEYRYVESVDTPDSPVETAASFVVEAGRPGAEPA
jgi:alkaline phosphatase D